MDGLFDEPLNPERRRGRGASTNATGRYEKQTRHGFDDGWGGDEADAPPLRTEVAIDRSRTIINKVTSPDLPFDRSVNPYRGCEHGCSYCFARPTHAQLGLSPGLDFETRLTAKPEAPRLLEEAIRKPGYIVAPIAFGTNTDPYQPVEKRWQIMRKCLEVLEDHAHPLMITTKGTLVTRDIDILARMAHERLAHVAVSLTSLDNRLSRLMEPRAASPSRRIAMIRELSRAGIPVHAMMAPIVPGLNEPEIERLVSAAAAAGARHASYITLRLPLEVSPLFQEWLAEHFPDRAQRVMGKVREMQGGRDYDPSWHRRMRGQGVHANLIRRRFEIARRKAGLDRPLPQLRTDLFRRPPRPGEQLGLFGD